MKDEGFDRENIHDGRTVDELEKGSDNSFEVKFDSENDKENPKNFRISTKWFISLILTFTSFWIAFISGIWSMVSNNVMEKLHVSHEVSMLGLSLYIWGLAIGGIFFSPISEYYGRKVVYIAALLISIGFQSLTAFCSNIGGMHFGRFMSGFFGSTFLSVAAGSLSDLFSKEEMKTPLLWYTVSPLVGPATLPIMMGFVNMHIYYRWSFYIPLIMTGVLLCVIIFLVPETYAPAILKNKAIKMRKVDTRYYASIEKKETSLFSSMALSFEKPTKLMFKDNMIQLLCFFTSLPMSILFLLFVALPYIFRTVFHFSLQFQGLAFVSVVIGMVLATVSGSFIFNGWFRRLVRNNNGIVKPEFRFLPLIVGIFIFPIGMFIVAWTSYSHLHWMGPLVGFAIFGVGSAYIFDGVFAYTEDAYRLFSATAIAVNTFTRCMMAGAFPLFGLQMYERMGIHWATTFLALIGCLLIPLPLVFFKYGEYLRLKSQFTGT